MVVLSLGYIKVSQEVDKLNFVTHKFIFGEDRCTVAT